MKKILWTFVFLYVSACVSYGVLELRILDDLNWGTLRTAFSDRQYPWQKKKPQEFTPVQSIQEEPAAEIPFANLSNIG